jgi:DNA processing protein
MNNINKIDPREQNYLQISRCIEPMLSSLYYIGKLPTERIPSVAIVGTRKPTRYGQEITYKLCYELATRGAVIISGMALGVDAIAHTAALDAGGVTIAVQANGLDNLTPMTNRALGERIVQQGGLVISEYEPGMPPLAHQFLARNRIVSGLADAVVVTEAASRSGTLNTAAHALAQGKEVYAVPGNVTSPMSAGCNQLIRQGATPLLSHQDLVEVLFPTTGDEQARLPMGSNALEQAIIDALSAGLRDGDDICAAAGASPHEFNTALTMLEISGIIAPLGGNRWRIA